MKRAGILLAMVVSVTIACAQDSLYVISKPYYIKAYSLASVDSLTFKKGYNTKIDTLFLHLTTGAKVRYATNIVDSVTFQSNYSLLPENPFLTQQNALDGVTALYQALNKGNNFSPYNVLFNVGLDYATDDVHSGVGTTNPDARDLALLLHTSTNRFVLDIWERHYLAIAHANIALKKIPTIDIEGLLKSRILGEARFLRALYYFNLVRIFGDVPLSTDWPASFDSLSRSPSVLVYEQIEQDLLEAIQILPSSYTSLDRGRATKGAALALLSKVYLTQASFPLQQTSYYKKAVEMAEMALAPTEGGAGTFGYSLQSNYNQVFLPTFKNNSEHLFSAQFRASIGSAFNTLGNGANSRSIKRNVPSLAGSQADQVWFYDKVDTSKPDGIDHWFSIFKLYAPNDKRRDVSFVTRYKSPSSGQYYGDLLSSPNNTGSKLDSFPYFNKYWDPTSNPTSESAANVPILRYAELLLIHAEAENEANGPTAKAYASLNSVRQRAGLDPLPEGLSQNQFRDTLYLDRRLELVFEYQRWFDLVRQRDAESKSIYVKSLHLAGKTNAEEKHRLHPIPQKVLDRNHKLTPNTGY